MSDKAKKVIWLLCSNRWNSAITEYALSSAQALRKLGHKVIFSPLTGTIGETRSQSYGLDTRSFSGFGLGTLFKFRGILNEAKPNAIFVFEGPETFLTKFFFGDTPVFRFRGKDSDANDGTTVRGSSHCKALIAPCDVVLANLQPKTKKKIHKIVLGCDTTVFNRFETMGGYLKKRPEIVLLGRLDPIKGHKHSMKIMRMVLDKWTDVQRRPKLHIVGQAANLSELDLETYARDAGLKLNEDVQISARRVTPIAKYLSEAVLGVIPSTGSEIICRVAEEFLLCGTPIVVSGVGSLEEVLFEGAGESYKGLGDEEAADVVSRWVQKSISEGEVEKRKRANEAKKRFSLEEMGRNLAALL